MGKKATFVIDEGLVEEVKEVVKKGLFKSMNSFVEASIKDELEKIRKNQIKTAIIEASNDPLFLSDIKQIEKDFEFADFEEAEK
jgi:Arc/MetJ-type ribon-helix-helix transcriptional regulator